MKRILFGGFLATLFVLVHSCQSSAIDVLDQSNLVAARGGFAIASLAVDMQYAAGQTVRVGIAGVLSRVQLGVFRQTDIPEPLLVDIVRTTPSGEPSFAAADRLATQTLTEDQLPLLTAFPQLGTPTNTVSVDFASAGLSFSDGDLFGIVLRSNADATPRIPPGDYEWWVAKSPVDSYPAGGSYSFQYSNNMLLPHGGIDTQFATYVVVPEPTSAALVAFAAVLFGCRYRRLSR